MYCGAAINTAVQDHLLRLLHGYLQHLDRLSVIKALRLYPYTVFCQKHMHRIAQLCRAFRCAAQISPFFGMITGLLQKLPLRSMKDLLALFDRPGRKLYQISPGRIAIFFL